MKSNKNVNSYVTGKRGMVVSAHPLASQAGVKILDVGGNAFDAAIAVASSLCVVEPYMSGLGGIGVALIYVSREKQTRALNFSGRCPRDININGIDKTDFDSGALSSLIPGVVSGWKELHQKYGFLEWDFLFESSINYAINGYDLTPLANHVISESHSKLENSIEASQLILGDSGNIPKVGATFNMPLLGNTLIEISKDSSTFYNGNLANKIVDGNRLYGGIFNIEDFNFYKAEWQTPIGISFNGYDIFTTPPNSSGFQILQTLKMLENTNFNVPVYQNIDYIHTFLQAIKLAVKDRIEFSCDPDYYSIPISRLLSSKYITELKAKLNDDEIDNSIISNFNNSIDQDRGMTTHCAVADQYGNVVSLTQTLGAFFGSGKVAGNTGIFLNNGCTWFDLDSKSCNYISPLKRTQFVLAPTQIFKNGEIYGSMGTTGGYGILQTTPQLLINLLSTGLDVQQSINALRFSTKEDATVILENQFPALFKSQLLVKGHKIDNDFNDPMGLGAAHGLVIASDGSFHGGADPRRDGIAIGLN